MNQSTLEGIESCYRSLYNYQQEAATDDYLAYLEQFNPEKINWKDEQSAKHALSSLISEIFEDCTDPEEVLMTCGVTQEFQEMLNC